MSNFKTMLVVAVYTTLAKGMILGLSDKQAAARKDSLIKKKDKGFYEVKEPIQLKKGEVFKADPEGLNRASLLEVEIETADEEVKKKVADLPKTPLGRKPRGSA